jgi:hypothetical protein
MFSIQAKRIIDLTRHIDLEQILVNLEFGAFRLFFKNSYNWHKLVIPPEDSRIAKVPQYDCINRDRV